MTLKRADLIGSALLAALGLAMFAYTLANYQITGEGGRVAPGLMPLVSSGLLVVCGVGIGLKALRAQPGADAQSPVADAGDEDAGGDLPPSETGAVALVFGLCFLAITLAAVLGFLPAFASLIFVIVAVLERRGVVPALLLSAGATTITWVVFVQFLRIPLPAGLLF